MSCVVSSFHRDVDEICALVVTYYRRFGTNYPSHLQGSRNPRILFLGFVDPCRWDCPETSARNYHSTLRNISEESTSQSLCRHFLVTFEQSSMDVNDAANDRTVSLHVCCSTPSVASPIGKQQLT